MSEVDADPSKAPLSAEQEARVRETRVVVERVAAKMARLYPALDAGAFLSLGLEALWKAARTYDPERAASFVSYAWRGIVGAMMDGLRHHTATDPARAAIRLFGLKALGNVDTTGDPFTDSDEDKLDRLKACGRSAAFTMAAAIGSASFWADGEEGLLRKGAYEQAMAALTGARASLEAEEDAIVEMHYFHELPWGEIARALGTSESTVKRRAAAIRSRLKFELQARGVVEAPKLGDS